MKKYLFFAAALLFAAISCTKETPDTTAERPDAGKQSGRKTIVLNIAGPDTKTYVSDPATGAISWEAGDVVGVFTDKDVTKPLPFTLSGEPGTSATFTGEVSEGASKIYVFYPYSAGATFSADATFTDVKITMDLPSKQSVGATNVAKGAMVTVGEATKGGNGSYSARLHNAFSYIKFKITGDDVKEIVLSGGADKLAGTATFSVADGTMTGTGTVFSSIRATKADGYFTKDTYYYIPVLPGSVAALSFSMTSNTHGGTDTGTDGFDDWKAERVAGSALTFTRGTGLKFDALDQGSKWSWYFDIHNAASLERFRALVAAGTFPASGVAKFTSDIDLSGVTLAAAAGTFKGTLDGQGHTITNWTSNGVSLLNLVPGTVKDFTLDSSCDLQFNATPGASFGFVCVDVQSGGVLDGVTNNASITQSVSVTGAGSAVLAPLAGRSYGLVQNCINNGNIAVTASAASQNVYLGGIVGYINSGDKLALYNNENHGDISYRVNAAGKYIYLGGIAAGTSTAAIASATASKGTIDACLNTGNITYISTNGGSLEENAGTAASGNYIKVGGVVGYFEGNVTNCINGIDGNNERGKVTVTIPTKENGACATGPSIGGVAAFVLRNMTGCKNYGRVSVSGTFAGGGTTNAGCGVTAEFAAGGVVGQIGASENSTSYSLNDCHNYGALELKGWMAYGNGTGFNFGGVAGYSAAPVSSCSNNASMLAESKGAFVRMGGVVGNTSSTASSLENNGALDFRLVRSTAGAVGTYKQLASQLRIGGVIGLALGNCTDLANKNSLKLTTTAADNLAAHLQIGGAVGYTEGTLTGSNEGKITITHSGKQVKCGGVLGESLAQSLSGCVNTGDMDITCGSVDQSWFGGVFGSIPAPGSGNNTHTGLENHGKIDLTITTSQSAGFYYLGGVAGTSAASQVYTNCKNYGDITYSGHAKMRIGGINAYMNQTAHGSVVECDITATCTGRDYSEVGGVSAYTAATGLTDWSFTGNINTSGSTKKVYTGGLLGKSNGKAAFNGCLFSGTLTGAAGNNVPGLYVGGLQANNLAMTFGATSKCVVAAGSKVNGVEVTSLTKDNLVSQSSDNGTYVSTATLTNIVIE
ncbi:MAG: hypothetical protein IJQ61_03370 [Bacteroidales bacterium]|nr:hypothetical protein [Bacteroidales bacterium]